MSVEAENHIAPTGARAVDLCAAEWLERRYREEWSETDQAELEVWFKASSAHRLAYLRVEAAWTRAHRLSALRRPGHVKSLMTRGGLPRLAKIIAATAILSMIGVGLAGYVTRTPEQVYATAIGEHRTIALGDGSHVELNTASILRVGIADGARTLWLEKGEAYFQVRHDSAHPFVTMAGGHRITDLGTKFLVRSDTDRLQVSLLEGRVRFDAPDGRMREPLLLSPGDTVTAKENAIVVTRSSPRELAKAMSWRHGMLVFDNTTLSAAAAEFNRYNRQKIVIAGETVGRLRIDGTFPAENLDVFARAAQQLFELHVENRGDHKVISR